MDPAMLAVRAEAGMVYRLDRVDESVWLLSATVGFVGEGFRNGGEDGGDWSPGT